MIDKEKLKKVGKVVAIIATPTIIVIIVFIFLYFYNRRKKKKELQRSAGVEELKKNDQEITENKPEVISDIDLAPKVIKEQK